MPDRGDHDAAISAFTLAGIRILRRWRRSGGTLDYYVTIHGQSVMGVVFTPELLAEISKLGISLGVEALVVRQRSRAT